MPKGKPWKLLANYLCSGDVSYLIDCKKNPEIQLLGQELESGISG